MRAQKAPCSLRRKTFPHPQVSHPHPPNFQTDDEFIESLEAGDDEHTWEVDFLEAGHRWAQIIDPPRDSTIPFLPASCTTQVLELIEFVIKQLGVKYGVDEKDVFETISPSGYEKIVENLR